jgi:hypothetical protein
MSGVYSQQQLELKFGAINERLSTIEKQLKALSDNAGVAYDEPLAEIPEDVVELVRAGKGVEAAKRYRELTGVDGAEAMKVIGSI